MLAASENLPTLLIVDDDVRLHVVFATLLEGEACQLVFATGGWQGLEQARLCRPDLILLDVILPDLDGLEVCRRLRADPQLGAVPILLLTALNDKAARLAGLAAGADDFIPKPFDATDLRARVRSTLRLNRYRQLYEERARAETQRKHAEDRLRQSEERHRSILEAVGDYVLVVDAEGRIEYINHGSEGVAAETIVGRCLSAWVAPSDWPPVRAAIQRVLAGGGAETGECRLLARSGQELRCYFKLTRLAAAGSPRAVLIAREVAEGRPAEDAVRRGEQRFA